MIGMRDKEREKCGQMEMTVSVKRDYQPTVVSLIRDNNIEYGEGERHVYEDGK